MGNGMSIKRSSSEEIEKELRRAQRRRVNAMKRAGILFSSGIVYFSNLSNQASQLLTSSNNQESKTSSASTQRTVVLIIDPQNDFHEGGSLAVSGSSEDAKRISALLNANRDKIHGLFVTLDTHQKFHIAHPMFWKAGPGSDPSASSYSLHPTSFSKITLESLEKGEWVTSKPQFEEKALNYVKKLESQKRFDLTIWPEHCLIGTTGHAVQEDIADAISQWEDHYCTAANYVLKGSNSLTEHYSAMKAEVEDPDDPRTMYNEYLLSELRKFDRIVVCGQAQSHCVNYTCRDILDRLDDSEKSKLHILKDCTSSVTGFEKEGEEFLQYMRENNARVITSEELEF